MWVVADSENGYFLDVDVYVSRPSDGVSTEHGLGARVVLQLTEPFRHRNHNVYCDNYFTSPALFDELLQHGIYACGTVRLRVPLRVERTETGERHSRVPTEG